MEWPRNAAPVDIDQILDLVMLAGEILIKSGGETYRVEDTLERIGLAAGAARVEPFATLTGLVVTVEHAEGYARTKVRRIRERGISLNKVAEVNQISRKISSGQITADQAYAELQYIQHSPNAYPTWVHLAAASMGSGCFVYLLGGNIRELGLAALAGLLIHTLRLKISGWGIGRLFGNFIGGLLAATVGVLGQINMQYVAADKVIIGAIMTLVPGLALTHAVRDVIYEDLLAGVARGMEAALVAFAVTAGVSIILGIWLGAS